MRPVSPRRRARRGLRLLTPALLAALPAFGPELGRAEPPVAAAAVPASAQPVSIPIARSDAQWRELLAAIPELAQLAEGFVAYGAEAARLALARAGGERAAAASGLIDGPFEWQPAPGQRFVILAGRSGAQTLLAVLAPDLAQPRQLASLVIADPSAALAIGPHPTAPRELSWTTCFGCAAQGGTIQLAANGRPVFTYR